MTQVLGTQVSSLSPKAMLKLFLVFTAVILVGLVAWSAANYIKNKATAAASQVAAGAGMPAADVFEVEA